MAQDELSLVEYYYGTYVTTRLLWFLGYGIQIHQFVVVNRS